MKQVTELFANNVRMKCGIAHKAKTTGIILSHREV